MDKSSECIKSYDGSADIATWLKKVKLVAKLKKVEHLEAFIPLYLDGPAFEVYDQLEDKVKDDGKLIEQALLEAFGMNKFSAYDSFRERNWRPGETVDVFLADLRRLAKLAAIETDDLICSAFVCGLPTDVSSQLRAGSRIAGTDLSMVLQQARVLMDERIQSAMVAVEWSGRSRKVHGEQRRPIRCRICNGDHLARHCKQKKELRCWNCDEVGHIARQCPNIGSGNDKGRLSSAPTASQVD